MVRRLQSVGPPMRPALALVALLLAGCTADILGPFGKVFPGGGESDPALPSPNDPPIVTPPPEPVVPVIGLRRLSRAEYDASLFALVGDAQHTALTFLPGDVFEPFDTEYARQQASAIYVEAAERVAETVTAAVISDPTRRAALLPCAPTGAGDLACLKQFTSSFGRLALRRPLTPAEVDEFTSLHALATQRGDFYTSMGVVMRRLLMDPEFIFRVEAGTPVDGQPGNFALTGYELASRLSFLLQGRTPPAWLLDLADAQGLATPEGVRAAATRLLSEPAGKARVESFHAMWLGFSSLPHAAAFNAQLVGETSALVRKVIFDEPGDYRRLFTSDETWADDSLAAHYGLTPSGMPGAHWLKYGTSGRKGILSHGALLSNGVKQTDTSPTLRGKWIRQRLFCQDIPPPPPNVVADEPPPATGSAVCKKDRYAVHDQVASCASCHSQMDPIGFGLEGYDRTGKFRSVEADHPECAITGSGKIEGVGEFTGPSGLADLMLGTGTVEPCVVKQVFRFTAGRRERTEDAALLAVLTDRFVAQDRRFDALLLELVAHPTFAQRRPEAP